MKKGVWEEQTLLWRIDDQGIVEEYVHKGATHRTHKKRKVGEDGQTQPSTLVTSWHLYQLKAGRKLLLRPKQGDVGRLGVFSGDAEIGVAYKGGYGYVFESNEDSQIFYLQDAPPSHTAVHQIRIETERERDKLAPDDEAQIAVDGTS